MTETGLKFFFLILTSGFFKCSKSELIGEEMKIIDSLNQNLNIKNVIIVQSLFTKIDFQIFSFTKHLSKEKIFTSLVISEKLEGFLESEVYYPKTLVFPQGSDQSSIFSSIFTRENNYAHYRFRPSWLVFNEPIYKFEKLFIPFNCQFLIGQNFGKDIVFKEIYHHKNEENLHETYFGIWNVLNGLDVLESDFYQRRFNMNGTALYFMPETPDGLCINGTECDFVQIAREFSRMMNFRLEFKHEKEMIFNFYNYNHNKSLSPKVFPVEGYLIPSIMSANYEGIDWIGPFWKVYFYYYIALDEKYESRGISPYFRPFSFKLWIVLVLWLLLVGSCLAAIKIKNKYLWKYYFQSFEVILNQEGDTLPQETSSRIIVLSNRIVAGFMVPAYLGSFLSFILLTEIILPFNNFGELMEKKGEYKIGYVDTLNEMILDAEAVHNSAEGYFVDINDLPQTFEEGVDRMCNDHKFVLIFPDIQESVIEKCKILKIPQPFFTGWNGIFMPFQSPYKNLFSRAIKTFLSTGILTLKDKTVSLSRYLRFNEMKKVTPVEIGSLVPIFEMIAIVYAVSLLMLYDVEVVDLSPDISFLIIVPPVETSCSVPGQKDILLERGDLMSVPVQVFEMVHLCTYQHDVISRYSRLSCILELDVILAQHSHREAFSSTEVQIAKDRLSKLQELQIQLNGVWKSVRWIMDVITFARDRGTCSNTSYNNLQISTKHTMSNSQSSFNKFQNLQTSSLSSGISNYGVQNIPGVSMKHLLALTKKKESNKKSPNRISKSKCLKENHQYVKCEKRSLLQIPDSPKDPKLLKSNLSRGSWPGPGVENTGNLLESSFSKSEQHLNIVGQEPFAGYYSKYSGSDCSASSHYVTVPSASYSSITSQPCGKSMSAVTDRDIMSNIGNRLPPSKSEDHLLLNQGLRSLKQSKEYRECRTRACSLNPTSVSATNSPLLPQKNIYGSNLVTTDAGSSLSIANTNTSDSLHSISSDESTAAVVSLPVTTPMRSGAGTGSLGSVQHSASLLSLAKPIIPTTGSLNSVNVPKPKIPVTVSLNSLSDKSIKRITSPPTSLISSGSILSGNTIPVNINQKPKNLELSASLSNVNVSDVLNQHISSSLPSFNPVIANTGMNSILPNVNPFSVPVNRQRIQSPVKSPIKTVSPIDTVLSSASSSKRSSVSAIDPFIPQEIDLLQHPGLPLDSPTSISSSLTSVSHNTVTSSGSSSNPYSESISSSYLSSGATSTNETEAEEDSEDLGNGVKVPTPSSGVLRVYAAYETGLAAGTSLKLHVTPRTSAREVVDLVVKQLNMAVVLKGKDGPIYSADKLKNFCLVAVIGARERCLRDDFKPLQLQNPWKKGRLYVRQKQDVLAALEHSSRQSAFL